MARIPVPLGPDTDGAKSRQGGGATLINCYVEKTEGGKTGFSVNTRPRLKAFSDTGLSSGFRGGIDANNAIYGVCGEKLVKIGSGGAVTARVTSAPIACATSGSSASCGIAPAASRTR